MTEENKSLIIKEDAFKVILLKAEISRLEARKIQIEAHTYTPKEDPEYFDTMNYSRMLKAEMNDILDKNLFINEIKNS
jgi:hypothetical protein